MKIDILSFYNAYDVLKAYQRKYEDVMNKLRNIALSSDTKYSVLIAVKENRIQTNGWKSCVWQSVFYLQDE